MQSIAMNNIFEKAVLSLLLILSVSVTNADTLKNDFRMERIAPVNVTKTADGSYVADFGKDAFGTLELKYKTTGPETLVLRLGEKLLDGRIDTNPGGTIRFAEVKLPVSPSTENYTLQLTPNKRNTTGSAVLLPDSFGVIMPFRYVEIIKPGHPITAKDLVQKAFFIYFDESQSDFTCSDTVLNKVWDLCKYSIKATSFAGIYIDGDRERIAYEADAYINQLGHYCTDREYTMAKKTIEHFMTHPTWPTEWLLHTALLMYQDYYYSGETGLLQKYYEQLKFKTLEYLAREDGLISSASAKVTDEYMSKLGFSDPKQRIRDIVDWPPAQKDTGWKLITSEGERDGHEMLPVNTVVNCFFYENMRIMAEIAEVLDKPKDVAHYKMMAEKVKNAINHKLFDTGKGIYMDGEGSVHSSLHSNMMAMAFGIVPPAAIKSVAEFVKSRGMACSVYGSQYLLEGLYRYEEGQYALNLMRATNDRSWWNMIRSGSTITMEAWDMKYKPNSDWNHAWGAAPANIIPRCLWGIRPGAPGYRVAMIRPQPGDLKISTVKTPTLLGPIRGEYRLVSEKLKTYSIEIPAGMVAEFYIKTASDEAIFINGKKAVPTGKSIKLNSGKSLVEIKKL
jgi:alpha-L-rhamnosidase